MDKKANLEKLIQGTLDSLNGLAPSSPAPFFYTRLQARLMRSEKNIWEKISGVIAQPAFAVLSIVLVVLLNTVVVVRNETAVTFPVPDQTEMAVMDEYKQATSFYDVENVQP